jgi:multidrug efflux pump subunit AcrA (membrane-fusion protein)
MPGMYAEATLTLEGKNNALVVPLTAIDQANGHSSVFLVDENNRLLQRQVQIGLLTDNDAEVLSGLTEGDRVVVSDRNSLKPGIGVRAQNADAMNYEGAKQ